MTKDELKHIVIDVATNVENILLTVLMVIASYILVQAYKMADGLGVLYAKVAVLVVLVIWSCLAYYYVKKKVEESLEAYRQEKEAEWRQSS